MAPDGPHLSPTLCSMMSLWWFETGHSGSIGTMGMDRSYKSGIFFLPGGGVCGTSVYIIVVRSHRATDLGKT